MIHQMNHITLAVRDIDRSFNFYRNVLDLKPLVRWDKGAYFLVGDFWFCLNLDPDCSPSNDYTHYAFSVSQNDLNQMIKNFANASVEIFKENTSPGDSLYFLDPDGHKLELHVGNWQTRLAAKKADIGSWKDVEWFD